MLEKATDELLTIVSYKLWYPEMITSVLQDNKSSIITTFGLAAYEDPTLNPSYIDILQANTIMYLHKTGLHKILNMNMHDLTWNISAGTSESMYR